MRIQIIGRPVIIGHRPWYRHPIFPWGWISLIQDPWFIKKNSNQITADGYYKPGDGGGGPLVWTPEPVEIDDGGPLINWESSIVENCNFNIEGDG